MNLAIERLRHTRKNFVSLIEDLSTKQLNTIPTGYNNNIIWNFAHTLASQQILCYKLSGLPMSMDNGFIEAYKKGSKPDGYVSDQEIALYKAKALELVDEFKADHESDRFKNFDEYTTSYGITISNILEAIEFVNIHEGLHLGYAMAQRKALLQQIQKRS